MKISLVKTAVRIGEFLLYPEHPRNKIKVNYDQNVSDELLKDESGRVYLFTVDGEIKKIGGSASKGGIKSTLSFYVNSMTGSPGKPRFILHLLIRDELAKGKSVEIYMINSQKTYAPVSGLFEEEQLEIGSFTEMEDKCRNDYFNSQRRFPDWNFKENNKDYPSKYSFEQVRYHEERLRGRVYIPD